jgi:uncharacterized protein YjbJ (UPF0337 family)
MSGTTDKIKGSVKETIGKVTSDKSLETEGKVDQAKGEAKNVARDVAEAAKGARDGIDK